MNGKIWIYNEIKLNKCKMFKNSIWKVHDEGDTQKKKKNQVKKSDFKKVK